MVVAGDDDGGDDEDECEDHGDCDDDYGANGLSRCVPFVPHVSGVMPRHSVRDELPGGMKQNRITRRYLQRWFKWEAKYRLIYPTT